MNTISQYILMLTVSLLTVQIQAQATTSQVPDSTDKVRVSLLTCSAGEGIYELFGHTAIRYEDPGRDVDIVFNYGLFDFDTPNFVWRFALGETDYVLGVGDTDKFLTTYQYYGRSVTAQYLNLSPDEKALLLKALLENAKPENRVYRYSYFYDNCSTRPRDMIESCINGQVDYRVESVPSATFRQIIHRFTVGYDWDRYGMDFCLGSEADRRATIREEMFVPFYLADYFAQAIIIDRQGGRRPLVSQTVTLTPPAVERSAPTVLTPLRVFLFLLMIIAAATIYGIRHRRPFWGIDAVLFGGTGLAGCLIVFLVFFSVHPAVSPNYLLFAFHPLHLLALPWLIRDERKGRRSVYHILNAAVLTLFLAFGWLLPQHFNPAAMILALCLLTRSAGQLVLTYKKQI